MVSGFHLEGFNFFVFEKVGQFLILTEQFLVTSYTLYDIFYSLTWKKVQNMFVSVPFERIYLK